MTFIIIEYDYERMLYDGQFHCQQYQYEHLKDYIENCYSHLMNDRYQSREYGRDIKRLRRKLKKEFETNGQEAAIKMMEESDAISCDKIKVFKSDDALGVLNFMMNYP